MPVADYKTYCQMIDRAKEKHFAYPAINVSSLTTANAVLKGLAESKSDGIIQVSTGGGAFASGSSVKDMALGAISIAEHVHRVAGRYPIFVALHTDHCQAKVLDKYVIPLIQETERRRAAGLPNLFNSHMFDGSDLPLKENLDIAVRLLDRCHRNELILEIEAGVVGGEEDGVKGGDLGRSSTRHRRTPSRWPGGWGRGQESPLLSRRHLRERPRRVQARPCEAEADGPEGMPGGRGTRISARRPVSTWSSTEGPAPAMEEIHEAVDYGVVKMNIDTDTQYAFTRAIADHMFKNYSGVLKVDGEVGNKKNYDPRSYLTIGRGRPGRKGEAGGPGAAGDRDHPLSGLAARQMSREAEGFGRTGA